MRHSTLGALALVSGVLLSAGSAAWAGNVLLTRESTIRASGGSGAGDYELADTSDDFSDFANAIDTVDAGLPGARVAANQNSRPSVRQDGSFVGAYAEGSASVAGQPGDFAEAASAFDLTFEVLGSPAKLTAGGAVGLTGVGSTAVLLTNLDTGDVVLMQELMGGSEPTGHSIDHSSVLAPGVYGLQLTANVSGMPQDESMAYYTMSLSLSAADVAESNATPVPLPPAVWSAAGTLAAAGLARGWGRLRRGRRAAR
jgi:hypothetical protein